MVDTDQQSREVPFEETEEVEESESDRKERELNLDLEYREAFGEDEDNERLAEEETAYAAELVRVQGQEETNAQAANLYEQSQSFHGPSLFKYLLILLMFAIPNDVIDVLDLTGLLMVLSWFISMTLSVTSIIVMWFADSELQRVKGHMKNIESYKRTSAKVVTKVAAKLTKFAPKNPVIKMLVGAVLEMIPIISILPWSSICTILAYLDERRAFKEAREGSADISPLSQQATEMV